MFIHASIYTIKNTCFLCLCKFYKILTVLTSSGLFNTAAMLFCNLTKLKVTFSVVSFSTKFENYTY